MFIEITAASSTGQFSEDYTHHAEDQREMENEMIQLAATSDRVGITVRDDAGAVC